MKLSEMRQVLDQRGIALTKSLGQNFLHDENQVRRIVEAAQVNSSDKVLEIGPGLGPLTEWLVAYAGSVTALELDQRLCTYLRERFVAIRNLTLIHTDALEYLRDHTKDWSDWKMVSNLPYSVASPILVEITQSGQGPRRMVVTLQYEVAKRLVAKEAEDDYGVLTLLLQLDYSTRHLFRIPSGSFFPEPEVESACVHFEKRPTPLLSGRARRSFFQVVKRSFSQRRKMMLKLLKQDWAADALAGAFETVGLSSEIRAERVSLMQFVQLTQELEQRTQR